MNKIIFMMFGMVIGLVLPAQLALADDNRSPFLPALTAKWWQWALSIPTSVNPQLDPAGQDCMVGQRGGIWFLAGTFGAGQPIRRTCSVPADVKLFFPIVNAINFNTPDVCGQSGSLTVKALREGSKASADQVEGVSVKIDGRSATKLARRIQSDVFATTVPEDNVFNAPCVAANFGKLPPGIYSPSVDEGFYVLLGPLTPGQHVLEFKGRQGGPTPTDQEVTYDLTVEAVSLK